MRNVLGHNYRGHATTSYSDAMISEFVMQGNGMTMAVLMVKIIALIFE